MEARLVTGHRSPVFGHAQGLRKLLMVSHLEKATAFEAGCCAPRRQKVTHASDPGFEGKHRPRPPLGYPEATQRLTGSQPVATQRLPGSYP